jgi:hypothetical protein
VTVHLDARCRVGELVVIGVLDHPALRHPDWSPLRGGGTIQPAALPGVIIALDARFAQDV